MPSSLNGRLNCIEHAFGSWTSRSVQCKTHLVVGFRVIANARIDLRARLPRCSRVAGKREVTPKEGLPTTRQLNLPIT
jgi:hypothetical protein